MAESDIAQDNAPLAAGTPSNRDTNESMQSSLEPSPDSGAPSEERLSHEASMKCAPVEDPAALHLPSTPSSLVHPPSLDPPATPSIPPLKVHAPSLHARQQPSIPPLEVHGPSLHTPSTQSIPALRMHAPSLHAPSIPAIPPLIVHAPSLHAPAMTIPPLETHAPSLHTGAAPSIPPLEKHAPSLHAVAAPSIPPLEVPPPSLHTHVRSVTAQASSLLFGEQTEEHSTGANEPEGGEDDDECEQIAIGSTTDQR